MHAFTVQHFTVLLSFFRSRQRADLDPVIHRHLSLISFFVGFEFVRFHFDGHVIFPVPAFMRGCCDAAIGE